MRGFCHITCLVRKNFLRQTITIKITFVNQNPTLRCGHGTLTSYSPLQNETAGGGFGSEKSRDKKGRGFE
jgi:hypothetical protein